MKRIALVLALLWPLSAQAADAIIHLDTPGQTLYARVMTSSTASVAVALTEGTSNAVGRYVITEASLVSGGLSSAGNYPFKVFSGTPSTSANDTMLGQGVLYWSGSTVLAAPADITFVLGEAVDADPATLNVNVTTIEGVDATDTIGTPQSGDSYALLGSPVGASVSADIAAILDDTGTSGVVVAAGTEIEVADADLRAALGMAAADLDTQLDAIVADTNELQTDWVNGGRLDLILDARSSQSSVDTIDGIVDAILLDTAEIGTAGAGLSAIPWRAAWDAEVQSEVADALAVYDPPTKAEMDSGFAGISITLSPEDIAAIAAAVDIDEASLTSAVWAYNSRTLTAGTNIVLAKGTGVTGFNDLDAAGIRSAVGLASANIDTQFSNISVTLSAQDIEDIVDGIIEGGGGVTPVSADIVGDSYTWIGNRYRASNIVEVENGFTGALALKPDMNPGVTITTVNSVTITGAATVTATGLTVDRSRTVAQFTVPELTTEGTYTVRVEVTTVDGAEITTTATLKVY